MGIQGRRIVTTNLAVLEMPSVQVLSSFMGDDRETLSYVN